MIEKMKKRRRNADQALLKNRRMGHTNNAPTTQKRIDNPNIVIILEENEAQQ